MTDRTISLEEHNKKILEEFNKGTLVSTARIFTGIKCEKCDGTYRQVPSSVICDSYPGKMLVECNKCKDKQSILV